MRFTLSIYNGNKYRQSFTIFLVKLFIYWKLFKIESLSSFSSFEMLDKVSHYENIEDRSTLKNFLSKYWVCDRNFIRLHQSTKYNWPESNVDKPIDCDLLKSYLNSVSFSFLLRLHTFTFSWNLNFGGCILLTNEQWRLLDVVKWIEEIQCSTPRLKLITNTM